MLIYENTGFLEVDSKNIVQLCRSTASVPLGNAEREAYEVHAALCDYLDNSEQRCRVALFSKTLKRSLVFAVKGTEHQSPWQNGREALEQLGFQLEDVDLRLSPAMQEVVLRDVAGILSPAVAQKERTEKAQLFAELQASFDKDPDSAQGKKAALKLNAEKHLKGRAEELRLFLEGVFSSHQAAQADIEEFARQMKDLTCRAETAEALAEAERNRREMSESITAAAEKRIQALEELLVDVETKSSEALKQKRKIGQLEGRIKKLDEALALAESEVEKERDKQGHLIAEMTVAHERISLLEDQLKDAAAALDTVQVQLAKEQAGGARLSESLKDAELRIQALDAGLKSAEEKAIQHAEAAKTVEGVLAQLAAAQQALESALNLNSALEEKLAKAVEQSEDLRESLKETEGLALFKERDEQRVSSLKEQNDALARELNDLRDEYDRESGIRKRLEDRALEEGRRVRALEDSLAKVSENTSEMSEEQQDFAVVAREVEALKVELHEHKQRLSEERKTREELESEIDEAHKIIESLERMVRATEETSINQRAREAQGTIESHKIQELESKLKAVESQLEQERIEQKRLVREVAVAEKKITEQEERLVLGRGEHIERVIPEPVDAKAGAQTSSKPAKPLPHELRPAPKKGALFRPDWDLEGLPCQSPKQVFKAWETAFNVQTALEGYPSQYCMAFLVVLRVEKQKKLYMLYRLKQSKHTLVCVPATTPKDDLSLEKAIKEGLNFLKMSGFAMEAMSTEHIANTLGAYFLKS